MSHHNRQCGLPPKVKRTLDLLVSFALLVALSPALFSIAILILLAMGRPILFRQQRPGRYGRPFTLYKFRTMANMQDAEGQLLPDSERLTRLGRLLRLLSVDELPQLWNVLRGDLSLVGPRPLLMHYLDRYSDEQARRHDVLPGITGWAQINGRNAITWEQKFKFDVWVRGSLEYLAGHQDSLADSDDNYSQGRYKSGRTGHHFRIYGQL